MGPSPVPRPEPGVPVGHAIFDSLPADLGASASRDQQAADREIAAQSVFRLSAGDADGLAAGRGVDDDGVATAFAFSAVSAAPLAAGALVRVPMLLASACLSVSSVAAPKDGQLTQPTNPHAHIVHGFNLTGVGQVSPDTLDAIPSPAYLRRSEPRYGRDNSLGRIQRPPFADRGCTSP